ncbi:afadin [Holotrichia oblita]|uniref:Afadin n=1 Tax=Holotrichia oblita TaxID=644536 RepID=A0ACB9TEE1_HOLOL|nr:afadin [Holotrichia oblita]
MFHVRRRPADCAPRKRKKKPGTNTRDLRGDSAPLLVELFPDGSAPLPSDTNRTIRLNNDIMEVGSANGVALQLYGPHIQPRHCVITNTDGVTSLTPCHVDAHIYVNGQRIHQTVILTHGSLIKFGNSNTYRYLDPSQEERSRHAATVDSGRIYDRSPRALSPTEPNRENFETTFDLEGNVETVSTASGAREDNRSLGSSSENRLSGIDRYSRGQDPILPAVLEFPEDPQELFLARAITHLDVTTPTFRLAPAYTLYLCARYRASTHYRPELTPTERAQKLTLLLQHAAKLIRHTVQDRSTESVSQAFWLANASELLHFLKSDRHVSAFSLQAQDTLADSVQLAFRNLVACLTDELNSVMTNLMSDTADDHPREIISVLSSAMNLLRKCRVNAALTIQLFSQLFHWISARSLSTIINNPQLCTRTFGVKLFNRLRNLQAWAESQGLELAAECHLAKIVQCAHLLQAPKYTADDLAKLSAACFKLNSLQLRALLTQYKGDIGEQVAPPPLLEHAARAAEGVADELARAEGREVKLHEDSAPPLQLLLPDDGFSCDVVQGVPPGLADFLHPLQASGLCRLAAQPTSSGHWTVYMSAPRPPSALSTTQPEVQVIRLHKTGGGMGLSIVAAKGAGQERLGIYIKSVVPGGAADRDGRLAAGDQLLSVDGQSLLGITQEKAAEFLVRTGSVVTLEVAKGGAVYHGLATLLQQPSPTPHRVFVFLSFPHAAMDTGSQESLYGGHHYRMYTPPITKPKNNVFFNSDDNLYRTETRQLAIPRIQIDCEPEFKLQITDFSEPYPRDVTFEYEDEFKPLGLSSDYNDYDIPSPTKPIELWKDKSSSFSKQKSYSLDVKDESFIDMEHCSDSDAYLTISNNSKKLKQLSSSLQDLSSSTSSINSVIHESNLDLSQLDSPIKQRNWKSPDEIRHGYVKSLARQFECAFDRKRIIPCAVSVPNLTKLRDNEDENKIDKHKRYRSATQLTTKLSEYERDMLQRLLQDWSIRGSEGINPEEIDFKTDDIESSTLRKYIVKNDINESAVSASATRKTKETYADFKANPNRNSPDEPKLKRLLFSELRNKRAIEYSKDDICISSCNLCDKKDDEKFKFYQRNLTSDDYTRYFNSNLRKTDKPFYSEPDLSPKTRGKLIRDNLIYVAKYNSESNVNKPINFDMDIMHKCKYRNCIFNSDHFSNLGPNIKNGEETCTKKQINISTKIIDVKDDIENNFNIENIDKNRNDKKLKGILKNSNEGLNTENQKDLSKREPIFLKNINRRYSEIIDTKTFNNSLIRCGSLERFTNFQLLNQENPTDWKKFPESYIVTRRKASNNNEKSCLDDTKLFRNDSLTRNRGKCNKSKVIVLKKKYYPKTWKSCSDIKSRQKPIRKCCRYAKTTCPILRGTPEAKRRTQSCADVSIKDDVYLGFKYADIGNFDCKICRPRRMSERDLPSRVDSERTIPSSKSVPALHHISPASDQPRTGSHDVFNPGYSRTSSNNSINTNSATPTVQNGAITNQNNLRSRSTHNLHQQDAGFYQNLSIYRNKMPSPQQLGDRTSALRSSQNSLQSNVTNSQRPMSAHYHNPPPTSATTGRLPLHQSIPNLKSPQESRTYIPNSQQNYSVNYGNQGSSINYPLNQTYGNQTYGTQKPNYERAAEGQYPGEGQNYTNSPYTKQHDEHKYATYGQRNEGSYPSPNMQTYSTNMQQPLHINANGQRTEEMGRHDMRYNTGLLREDYRQRPSQRNEELITYPNTNNVRTQDAQVQQNKPQDMVNRHEDFNRANEMRTSKSEDMLRQYSVSQNDMFRYASSGNIKDKTDSARPTDIYQNRINNDDRKDDTRANTNLRGQAKLAEMGEEVRRRQNRNLPNQFHSPNNAYYQQHQQYYSQQTHTQQNVIPTHIQIAQNTQSMQNLSLSQNYQPNATYPGSNYSASQQYPNQNYPLTNQNQNYPQNLASSNNLQSNYYGNQPTPTSPNYTKNPPIAPKPLRKPDDPPELPPTSTHPLYSASTQDPPKMSLYSSANALSKNARDPWAREEQEKQAEMRREHVRAMREQQIKELMSIPNRTQQQEDHLRVLQLEREFQRRAMEEPEQEDEDTEKESSSYTPPQTVPAATPSTTASNPAAKQEPPASILKPGAPVNNQQPPPEPQAPPPPERGSSYAVMSLRNKEGTKRVSFNDASATPQPPTNLQIEETVREDPNVSMIIQREYGIF